MKKLLLYSCLVLILTSCVGASKFMGTYATILEIKPHQKIQIERIKEGGNFSFEIANKDQSNKLIKVYSSDGTLLQTLNDKESLKFTSEEIKGIIIENPNDVQVNAQYYGRGRGGSVPEPVIKTIAD